jgi:hypothetical protein
MPRQRRLPSRPAAREWILASLISVVRWFAFVAAAFRVVCVPILFIGKAAIVFASAFPFFRGSELQLRHNRGCAQRFPLRSFTRRRPRRTLVGSMYLALRPFL